MHAGPDHGEPLNMLKRRMEWSDTWLERLDSGHKVEDRFGDGSLRSRGKCLGRADLRSRKWNGEAVTVLIDVSEYWGRVAPGHRGREMGQREPCPCSHLKGEKCLTGFLSLPRLLLAPLLIWMPLCSWCWVRTPLLQFPVSQIRILLASFNSSNSLPT